MNLIDNCIWYIIFVKLEQLPQEVLLSHESLGSQPPIVFQLLWIVLLGSLLTLAVTHHADGVQNLLYAWRRVVEDLDLVDMRRLDGL